MEVSLQFVRKLGDSSCCTPRPCFAKWGSWGWQHGHYQELVRNVDAQTYWNRTTNWKGNVWKGQPVDWYTYLSLRSNMIKDAWEQRRGGSQRREEIQSACWASLRKRLCFSIWGADSFPSLTLAPLMMILTRQPLQYLGLSSSLIFTPWKTLP